MKAKTYFKTSGVLFGVIGVVHLWRALNGWPVTINRWVLPLWVSWIVVAVGLTLAYRAFRLAARA